MTELIGQELSDSNFKLVQEFLEARAGLKMTEEKRAMVAARLHRLIRTLGMSSLDEYCQQMFSGVPSEDMTASLIDAMTTNKTDFMREPRALDYLRSVVLPQLASKAEPGKPVDVWLWSAACSSGEEPYSIAMTVAEFNRGQPNPRLLCNVLATDICAPMLKRTQAAVYTQEGIAPLSEDYRKRYLLRGRDPEARTYRIVPELRRQVRVQQLNLVQPYSISPGMDVAFCRNVLIYFGRDVQVKVMKQICRSMKPGGYLFMGHAEPLTGMDLPLELVDPLIYRKFH